MPNTHDADLHDDDVNPFGGERPENPFGNVRDDDENPFDDRPEDNPFIDDVHQNEGNPF